MTDKDIAWEMAQGDISQRKLSLLSTESIKLTEIANTYNVLMVPEDLYADTVSAYKESLWEVNFDHIDETHPRIWVVKLLTNSNDLPKLPEAGMIKHSDLYMVRSVDGKIPPENMYFLSKHTGLLTNEGVCSLRDIGKETGSLVSLSDFITECNKAD